MLTLPFLSQRASSPLLILPQSPSLWHHTFCSQVEPLKLGCLAASLQNSLNINQCFYSRVKYLISCPALPVPSFRSPWSSTVVCKMCLTVVKSFLNVFFLIFVLMLVFIHQLFIWKPSSCSLSAFLISTLLLLLLHPLWLILDAKLFLCSAGQPE